MFDVGHGVEVFDLGQDDGPAKQSAEQAAQAMANAEKEAEACMQTCNAGCTGDEMDSLNFLDLTPAQHDTNMQNDIDANKPQKAGSQNDAVAEQLAKDKQIAQDEATEDLALKRTADVKQAAEAAAADAEAKKVTQDALIASKTKEMADVIKKKSAETAQSMEKVVKEQALAAANAVEEKLMADQDLKNEEKKAEIVKDEMKKLATDTEEANHKLVKAESTKKKEDKAKQEAVQEEKEVIAAGNQKVAQSKMDTNAAVKKILLKANADAEVHRTREREYNKQTAMYASKIKAFEDSLVANIQKKVEISKLKDPTLPGNVVRARLAAAKAEKDEQDEEKTARRKAQEVKDQLVKKIKDDQEVAATAAKLDERNLKAQQDATELKKEQAEGKAATEKAAEDKIKMIKLLKDEKCQARCTGQCGVKP